MMPGNAPAHRGAGIRDRMVFVGALCLLVFAPLAFGAVHVWAYTVLAVGVFALLAVAAGGLLTPGSGPPTAWIKTPANGFLLLFLAWSASHMVPLPPEIIGILSPGTYADKLAGLRLTVRPDGAPAPDFFTIAYSPYGTFTEWLRLAACLGLFFLLLYTLNSKRRIDIAVWTLIGVGVFESLYGIAQVFSDTPRIWWTPRGGSYASGTFTVSNHFCFYLEMLFPLAIGFAVAHRKGKKRLTPGLGKRRALVQRLVGGLSPESANPKALMLLTCALVMGAAILLSASRGGILSMGAAMAVMALILFRRRDLRRYGLLTLGICLAVVFYGLQIGIDPTLNKFERVDDSLRVRLYHPWSALPVVGDYPLTGVGLRNLRELYPRYRPADPIKGYKGISPAGHIHNDWVEAAAETGLPGAALLVAGFALFFYRMAKVWRRRRNRHAVGIGAGVLTGLIAVALHSLFDFSLRIPANPATLAAMAAVGYAALHRKGPDYDESFFYRVRTRQLPYPLRAGVSLLFIGVLAVTGFGAVRHLQAEFRCPTQYNSTLNLNYTPYLADIETAIDRFPWNPGYHLQRARFYNKAAAPTDDLRRQFNDRAAESLTTSLRLNPAQPYAWYLLGRQYARRNDNPSAYFDHWLPLADQCMDMSVGYAPREESTLARAALYWTWRAAVLPGGRRQRAEDGETEGQRDKGTKGQRTATHNSSPITSHFSPFTSRRQAIDKFQSLFQRYLTLAPGRWEWAAEQVHAYHPDPGVLMGLAPEGDEETARRILRWTVGADSPRPEDAGP